MRLSYCHPSCLCSLFYFCSCDCVYERTSTDINVAYRYQTTRAQRKERETSTHLRRFATSRTSSKCLQRVLHDWFYLCHHKSTGEYARLCFTYVYMLKNRALWDNSLEIAAETEPWLKSLFWNQRERQYFVNDLLRFVYIYIPPYVCRNVFYTRRNTHSNTHDANTSKRTYTHIHTEDAPTQTYMHTKYVVRIHTYTDTNKHACTRILAYTHRHHTCMYACMQDMCMDVLVYGCIHTQAHLYIHAYMHTRKHTCTPTHIKT